MKLLLTLALLFPWPLLFPGLRARLRAAVQRALQHRRLP